jgi:hypothetical protein
MSQVEWDARGARGPWWLGMVGAATAALAGGCPVNDGGWYAQGNAEGPALTLDDAAPVLTYRIAVDADAATFPSDAFEGALGIDVTFTETAFGAGNASTAVTASLLPDAGGAAIDAETAALVMGDGASASVTLSDYDVFAACTQGVACHAERLVRFERVDAGTVEVIWAASASNLVRTGSDGRDWPAGTIVVTITPEP